ncbi:MAG: ATP-binding protein [Bacteroidales bacterium]|nr:ATP-binding protein [Bacteroidales bacterium]
MKDNLQFRVSAELKNILGRDLITSPDIAILELVKNSYDAHASKVEITFDHDYLSIADNGKGMSKDDLINKWLFVAYSAKSDGTEDKSYRSKFKRHYAGAKGIGRMSCDRLARHLILTTRSTEENKTEILDVDWSVFEMDKQAEFDTVDIPHETKEDVPKLPLGSPSGTILEFTGLYLPWKREDIKRLKKSLEKMINPFSGTDDDFQIEIIAPEMKDEDARFESNHDKVNGVIENSIADVLGLKTTQIESHIRGREIHTVLRDRGILMYEIKEKNTEFSQLESASISLFFLNRAAKYSFTSMMGVQPVSYGNVFLFRNGFRILPFGESNDDSWGLNRRQQQGRNRFLGTRNLFGRVDVETDDPDLIKEVSSRDGGLIETEASQQLMNYFSLIYRRLERYVVGVLWGEGFLRKDYFVSQQVALDTRKQLQKIDKDSDTAKHLYSNIGSKVDFLQLIKSIVNDKSITVLQYNEDLANIVADPTDSEVIQAHMIDDVRKLAEKTDDTYLLDRIAEFEKYMDELRRQKEEAERKAEEEHKAKEEAERKAEIERKAKEVAERKAKEEEGKRKRAEIELKQKSKQTLFLQYVGSLDTDRILKYHHDIRIHSATIHNTIGQILRKANKGALSAEDTVRLIERISRANDKITSIAQFATKANYSINADSINADIISYIVEYINNVLPEFYGDLTMHCTNNTCTKILDFYPLEASIFIDNLVSNAVKANAKHFDVFFDNDGESVLMTVSDDGDGLSSDISDPSSILEKGYTTTNGSGLGLYNVASFVKNVLNGVVSVESDPRMQGFVLRIKF